MNARAVFTQIQMEIKRTLRDRRFVLFTLLMPMVFYFIFVNQIGGATQVDGANWDAYYMMSMSSFGVIGASLTSLGIAVSRERMEGWMRLIRTTPLPNGSYLFSKMVAQLMLNLGIIAVIFLAGGLIQGVHLSVGQWLACGLWIWLASTPFLMLGLMIGSAFSPNAAQVAATAGQLGLAMLGGLWMPLSVMSETMRNIAEWLPTYHFAHVPWELAAGRGFAWTDLAILAAYLIVFVILSKVITKRQEAIVS